MRLLRGALLGAVSMVALTQATYAETLKQALTSTYMTNPGLDAQRASLRASDEEVPRAKAGYRPTITGNGDAGVVHSNTKPSSAGDGEGHPKGLGLTMSQSLFRGFRVFNSVNVAEANVRAAREVLRQTEQTTLLDAVGAYLDVVRDQGILRVRENNVKVLTNELRATQERFAVGEVTKTDVAQAEASRAASLSALDLAKSNLRTDLANYERVVGHPAGQVIEPPALDKSLPKNMNEAIQLALAEHPNVVQSVYLEQAARHQVDLIKGELLPTVSMDTNYTHRYEPSRTIDQTESTTVTGRVTWQFWNGGEVESRIRQAKHTSVSRLQQIEQQKGVVQAGAVQAWSTLIASRAAVISDQQAVASNRTALAGVREEEKVGQRTLLDVLNAEQALLNSEVTLFTDKRNFVFASYNLLSAVGRLNAIELKLNSNVYDETAHYDEVKRKMFGTGIDYSDGQPQDASAADANKGGSGRLNSARLRPAVTRPSDLNVAPLPRRLTAPAPTVAPDDPNKPLAITPLGRGSRKPTVVPASAPQLSPPLESPAGGRPLPPLSPPLEIPVPLPPAGTAPKSGQRFVPSPATAATAFGQGQTRGNLDGGWTAKIEQR